MRLDFERDLILEDDQTIRQQLSGLPLPQLLAAIAHLTGEYDLPRDEFRPDPSRIAMLGDSGYLPEQIERGYDRAAAALVRYRDSGSTPAGGPSDDQLGDLIRFVAGPVDVDHLEMLKEELALGGADLRAPSWRAEDVNPDRSMSVAVVGAGMSGIAAAHRLRQAGFTVHVYEKDPDLGGTWYENSYPGCRVDVPNHVYSYSFAQTPYWPQFHSTQPVLLEYFRACADAFGVTDLISFSHEVESAVWSDELRQWSLTLRTPYGTEEVQFQALVCAVGQLNRPANPDIPGLDTFEGESFHSARWDHQVEFDARRVGVIGTGASAVQFIPWLAERVEQLTVYQRTPPWLLPKADYHDELPANLRWVLRHIPEYARWDRLALFASLQEGLLPRTIVDPEWDLSRGSVSEGNDEIRRGLTLYYEIAFPDEELRAKVLPNYPFGAKRMVLDSGAYSAALQAPNVSLEVGSIAAITPTGVELGDGRTIDHDVLVYGTGFQASNFLTPMRIAGRKGVDLHERWGGDARAHLGMTVPEFPNLFLMYGPNTNIVVNGSIVYFSECQAHYITESLRLLLDHHADALDCRPEAHDAYNAEVDAATELRAWGASDVNSWYKNSTGRVAQNWPFDLFEYWKRTRTVDLSEYDLL